MVLARRGGPAHTSLVLVATVLAAVGAQTVLAQDFPYPGAGYERGDTNALITVVEFADYGCPACAEFAVGTFPTIEREYIASGQIRWKIIPFQLGPFRHSKKAAQAAICAAEQGAFWEMHDYLYADQDRWQVPRDPLPAFQTLMARQGGDTTTFAECYDRSETGKAANQLRSLARKVGVRATPTFLIEGRWALGALSPAQFGQLIEEARSARSIR